MQGVPVPFPQFSNLIANSLTFPTGPTSSAATAEFWAKARASFRYRWTENEDMSFIEAKLDDFVKLLRAMLKLEPKKREKIGKLLGYEFFANARTSIGKGRMRVETVTSDDKSDLNSPTESEAEMEAR
jgi:hypothetical protein